MHLFTEKQNKKNTSGWLLAGSKLLIILIAVILLLPLPQVTSAQSQFDEEDAYFASLETPPAQIGTTNTKASNENQVAQQKEADVWKLGLKCAEAGAFQYVFCSLIREMLNGLLFLISFVVALAGKILDGGMYYTVNMSGVLASIPIVDIGWTIFRDLANMVFIFILLYIAIATILNIGNTRKMLVDVIITALLINFSLFFTKAFVDGTNLVAAFFYDRLNAVTAATQLDGDAFKGPSAALRDALRLQTMYAVKGEEEPKSDIGKEQKALGLIATVSSLFTTTPEALAELSKAIQIAIFGSIVMLVTAFVLAAGGLLLFIRIVVLMLLMILSPLAIVARILPRTKSAWDEWLKAFVNHAIWAPVYMALMYAVIQAVSYGLSIPPGGGANLIVDPSGGTFSSAGAGDLYPNLGLMFNFLFSIFLLIGVILVSKRIGITGGAAVQGWATGAGNWVRNKTRQTGGWAFRRTIGEGARRIEERAKTSPGANTWIVDKLRNVTTRPAAAAKVGGAKSALDAHRESMERKSTYDTATTVRTALVDMKGLSSIQDARERGSRAQQIMARLSTGDVAVLPKDELLRNPSLVQAMSASQLSSLKNRKDLTDSEVDQVLNLRYGNHANNIRNYSTQMQQYKRERVRFLEDLTSGNKPPKMARDGSRPITNIQDFDKEFAPAIDPTTYNFFRGVSDSEIKDIHRLTPDVLFNPFSAPILRQGKIDSIRGMDEFGTDEKERMRDFKNAGVAEAIEASLGINTWDESYQKLEPAAQKAVRGAAERAYKKSLEETGTGDVPLEVGYEYEKDGKKIQATHKIAESEAMKRGLMGAGKNMMTSAFEGKNAEEISKTPGRFKFTLPFIQRISSAELKTKAFTEGTDISDIKKAVEHLLWSHKTEKERGVPMSPQNEDALRWLFTVKEGKSFFSQWDSIDPKLTQVIDTARTEFESGRKPKGSVNPAVSGNAPTESELREKSPQEEMWRQFRESAKETRVKPSDVGNEKVRNSLKGREKTSEEKPKKWVSVAEVESRLKAKGYTQEQIDKLSTNERMEILENDDKWGIK